MSRSKRKLIADETVAIMDAGSYTNQRGEFVQIGERLHRMKEGTELLVPANFDTIISSAFDDSQRYETKIEVFNETTFAGSRALLDEGASRVCCLNFASAKKPGGGFLTGSQAQEEALARASGLYASLQQALGYYEFHREGGNALYSHHMIYSPDVPVFRDDADRLIDEAWETSIITSAAVNAGALRKNSPELESEIIPVMRDRIARVIALAASRGHTHLVLGAWGCGVFRNDPVAIANLFAESLEQGPACKAFEIVRFSVLDQTQDKATFHAFQQRLSP